MNQIVMSATRVLQMKCQSSSVEKNITSILGGAKGAREEGSFMEEGMFEQNSTCVGECRVGKYKGEEVHGKGMLWEIKHKEVRPVGWGYANH